MSLAAGSKTFRNNSVDADAVKLWLNKYSDSRRGLGLTASELWHRSGSWHVKGGL